LHIGGARTALFNYLYAKRTGGEFLLRIEDTDRERSTEAAVKAIFEGLTWLGLKPDREPVFQFTRADRHREAALQMLERGGAYRDWSTPEETEAQKAAALAKGEAVRSPWRERDPAEAPAGAPFVVRLKAPTEGETVVDDLVQGPVRWKNAVLDDLVLLRSDGTPTYNLAVVVDDHDMGVTHVIRGDDHLNNAARQTLIYRALGWEVPAFAHISLIHGPDGAKLSKRHGAQAVGDFAELGYLPEAMRNYLARLGWSHGDDELFSDQQAAAWFDIADVNKGAARLDWDKLAYVNAHWMRQADDARLAGLVAETLARRGETADPAALVTPVAVLKGRAKTVVDLADQLAFVRSRRPLELDPKTVAQLTEETRARLTRLSERLRTASDWTVPALEADLKAFADAEGVGMGKFGPALRGCLAGSKPAPGLAETLVALGREESLGRLDDALSSGA
jgi:glutamyl-tRNA synthetase